MKYQPTDCFHCGEPVPGGPQVVAHLHGVDRAMCCVGCKAVAEFIESSGLSAFYEHRDQPDATIKLKPAQSDWRQYDQSDLKNRYVHSENGSSEAAIDIGGMYCAACVWLLNGALSRVDGVGSIDVNPSTRRAIIRWDSDRLRFSDLLGAIADVGFKPAPVGFGEPANNSDDEYRAALKRLIVAAAAGMQVMMFAVALYAGEFFGIDKDIETYLRAISLLVSIPIVFYAARPFFSSAWRGLMAGLPGMDLPISIAIFAALSTSVFATLLNRGDVYFDSVAMFVFFVSATRFLEMRARHRSDDHAAALARLLPDTVVREVDGRLETIALDTLREDDSISIRPGDIVPADGVVLSGVLSIDESMLTGESFPAQRDQGCPVHAGTIVRAGNAIVSVTRTGASTNLAEIGRLLERAKADRPPIALLADRVASKFVVGVLTIAMAAGVSWYFLEPGRAFEVMLATLVVTCPCALAIATPAAIAAATARLARSGFLIVRARVLTVLERASVVVFDKTGTLTKGQPVVLNTHLLSDKDTSSDALLSLAAAIETSSEHVLARAFTPFYEAGRYDVKDVSIVFGSGIEATVGTTRYRIGEAGFVAVLSGTMGITPGGDDTTAVFIGDSTEVVARFDIGDKLREGSKAAINDLSRRGLRPIIASGDRNAIVRGIAKSLQIEDWHGGMSPADKLAFVQTLRQNGETVVMVGDGINDAPVIAAADASIALGAGTAVARASADAISLGNSLHTITSATEIASVTRRVIAQNITWAIFYNAIAVPLAVSGVLTPWMAAIGMSASSLLVVMNALRLHRTPIEIVQSEPRTRAIQCGAVT